MKHFPKHYPKMKLALPLSDGEGSVGAVDDGAGAVYGGVGAFDSGAGAANGDTWVRGWCHEVLMLGFRGRG